MLPRISLWTGLIGLAVTMPLLPTIAVARTAGEVLEADRTLTEVTIARRVQGTRDYFGAAAQKYQRGDYPGALADYNRAIKINSRSANAYYNRGLLKATKLQDDRGALADYDRAIQLKPNYDAAYNNRGNLKAEKLQDYQGALADYNRAIQLKPSNANAYYNRGVLKYTFLNDRAGGIADLQQVSRRARKQGKTQEYQAAIYLLQEWQQTSER
ncbi:tetratricopeptide repeat protein [Chamaesiphon sp.]|uniref:tetratricopeptide repeat protein n=1 Tax=Chamaesiphon sp. TaxID=2814140 RepID=UPI00359345BF